jgi:hypothetical protein
MENCIRRENYPLPRIVPLVLRGTTGGLNTILRTTPPSVGRPNLKIRRGKYPCLEIVPLVLKGLQHS